MEELFMKSPTTRDFVSKGYAMVVGAVYDIGTGNVTWLSEDKTFEILTKVEASKDKVMIEEDSAKEESEPTKATEEKAQEEETEEQEAPQAEEPKVDKA
ncbi:MAG: hypothetical protein HQK63_14970 [Desulfamplus sp.]|nr:hypothetical protein [Desulfamplus sp.]